MHQTNLNGGLEAEADVLDVAKLTGLDLLVTNALLVLEDEALLLIGTLVLLFRFVCRAAWAAWAAKLDMRKEKERGKRRRIRTHTHTHTHKHTHTHTHTEACTAHICTHLHTLIHSLHRRVLTTSILAGLVFSCAEVRRVRVVERRKRKKAQSVQRLAHLSLGAALSVL